MPHLPVPLKSLKKQEAWRNPTTLGEHILRARMDEGLTQRGLAERLGVSFTTVLLWEKSQTEPRIKDMPCILQFLGYDPFPEANTLGERMLAYRRRNGLDFKDAAALCKLNWETWMYWKVGKNKKWWPSTRRRLKWHSHPANLQSSSGEGTLLSNSQGLAAER